MEKQKKILLSTSIVLAFLMPIGFLAIQNLSVMEMNETNNVETIDDVNLDQIIQINGQNYIAEYITEEKVEEMKEKISLTDQTIPSEGSTDGFGTGYTAPTAEDLETLIGKMAIKEVISNTGELKTSAVTSKDLSTQMYFPVVGDQGRQLSCTSWALTYYAYGYMEAKDNEWDASSGNRENLLSPAWAYNKVNFEDRGCWANPIGEILEEWGAPTMSTMPYNARDVDNWGEEAAWREAPYHRPLGFHHIWFFKCFTVNVIKSLINLEIPVAFGINSRGFKDGLSKARGDYILSSEEYGLNRELDHYQCIVGFNDSITEGSDVGAFRVVNSWGTNDGYTDKGYYWLTYDAFNQLGDVPQQDICFFTDRKDYQPNLIASWEFSTPPFRMEPGALTLGIGSRDAPLDTIVPFYGWDFKNFFPSFMTLDISEFDSYSDASFFLDIKNINFFGKSKPFNVVVRDYMESSHKKISAFRVERYGSIPKVVIARAESPFGPTITPGYVECCFGDLAHELKVTLDIPNKPIINSVNIVTATISNVGNNVETGIELSLSLNDEVLEEIPIDTLRPNEERSIEYDWAPTKHGYYNFTANVPPIPGETFIANNEMKEMAVVFIDSIIIDNKEPNSPDSLTWDEAVDNGICIKSGCFYIIQETPIYGLYINNSNVQFIIMNCLTANSLRLEAKLVHNSVTKSAIFLENTTEGVLVGNYMPYSSNLISLSSAGYAIYLTKSSNNTICGNDISRCGGILLDLNSDYNSIERNSFTDCYRIELINSSHNMIRGNNIVRWGKGIMISFGSNNYIYGNYIDYCYGGAILLDSTNDNKIEGNEIKFSFRHKNEYSGFQGCGIYIKGNSNENTIKENIIKDFGRIGIYLGDETFNNVAYLNILIRNGQNAEDRGTNNHWDNGTIGNLWVDHVGIDANGDGIVDVPYTIPGPAGSVDNFPIVNDIPIITSPADISYKKGDTGNEISWTVTGTRSDNREYVIFINGEPLPTETWSSGSAIVINVDKLEIGTYNFTIKIHDGYGGFILDEVMVEVKPIIPATPYIIAAMIVALVGVGIIINRKIKR